MSVGNASLGQVVGRHLERDAVACQDADAVATKSAGQMREHHALLIQLDAELPARKFLYYGSGDFNAIFFAHPSFQTMIIHSFGRI